MLVEAEVLGIIEGIKNVIPGMSISHLQFTDDTILFLKADKDVVRNTNTFSVASKFSQPEY